MFLDLSDKNLIWVDMEMTGLFPEDDRIIEIGIVVTDSQLENMVIGPILAIYQDEKTLLSMDKWNTLTHNKSGLVARVRESQFNENTASKKIISFLSQYVPAQKSPMCGNSICQDRRFMIRWMPELENFFHYRNLDVSTLKELVKRWRPDIDNNFVKNSQHTVLSDIKESIIELKYYRKTFINTSLSKS